MTDNQGTADYLTTLAALLELEGASRSRPRNLRGAASIIASAEVTVDAAAIEAGLEGIGQEAAAVLTEYLTQGSAEIVETLRGRFPAGLVDVVTVHGIGAGRARALQETLGVDSLEKLIAAAEDGSITSVKGIGARSAEKILEAARENLARRGSRPGRALKADRQERILDEMRGLTDEVASDVQEEPEGAPSEREEDSARFAPVLRCQSCYHEGLRETDGAAECPSCAKRYDVIGGIVDFIVVNKRPSLMQRLMEYEPYTEVYENIARPLVTRVVSARTIEEEVELAADMMGLGVRGGPEAPMVLDVACGPGNFTRRFADRVERGGGFVVGVDLSWAMLRKAEQALIRRREDNLRYVRADASRLPFADQSFDAVHCAGALHLMAGVDGVLQEFARVVKPGGLVVIGTFVLGNNPLKRVVKRASGVPVGFRWFDRHDLNSRMDRVGLEVQEHSINGSAITVKATRV